MFRYWTMRLGILVALGTGLACPAQAQESGSARGRLEAAAGASLGGPGTAEAQQEQDRLRRLQMSRWPGLDAAIDPVEDWRQSFSQQTGLTLSFDYQALYQHASDTVTGVDRGAAGQARILGNWALADRGGDNPGGLVFILEHRHKLGQNQTPAGLAGEIGYIGLTGLTFGDNGAILSVAYWSQKFLGGRGGLVAGRIDPGDYTDILGYVNPRTGFQNFSINYNPVLPIPDPGFGIGAGIYLSDQIYVLGVATDANGSLNDVEWFPGGAEFYKYAEIGWTPARSQRYLTNIHLGVFHLDARTAKGLPSSRGAVLSGNYSFGENLMIYGRLGWSEGSDPIARRAASAGLLWRPGFYDDLIGLGATWAEPVTAGLANQTTIEAFYRLDISDNFALTADVQYLHNPGLSAADPLVVGLRLRINL